MLLSHRLFHPRSAFCSAAVRIVPTALRRRPMDERELRAGYSDTSWRRSSPDTLRVRQAASCGQIHPAKRARLFIWLYRRAEIVTPMKVVAVRHVDTPPRRRYTSAPWRRRRESAFLRLRYAPARRAVFKRASAPTQAVIVRLRRRPGRIGTIAAYSAAAMYILSRRCRRRNFPQKISHERRRLTSCSRPSGRVFVRPPTPAAFKAPTERSRKGSEPSVVQALLSGITLCSGIFAHRDSFNLSAITSQRMSDEFAVSSSRRGRACVKSICHASELAHRPAGSAANLHAAEASRRLPAQKRAKRIIRRVNTAAIRRLAARRGSPPVISSDGDGCASCAFGGPVHSVDGPRLKPHHADRGSIRNETAYVAGDDASARLGIFLRGCTQAWLATRAFSLGANGLNSCATRYTHGRSHIGATTASALCISERTGRRRGEALISGKRVDATVNVCRHPCRLLI